MDKIIETVKIYKIAAGFKTRVLGKHPDEDTADAIRMMRLYYLYLSRFRCILASDYAWGWER